MKTGPTLKDLPNHLRDVSASVTFPIENRNNGDSGTKDKRINISTGNCQDTK